MQHGIEVKENASDEEKETNTGISKIKLSESKTQSQDSEKPWEKIPDHLWDKQALNMWHEGYTNSEIAKKVCVTPERVTNRISELRKEHGSGIVPFDEDRRKKLRGNKYRKE
jgi:DNA-binding NarL/FixJ family response regulator